MYISNALKNNNYYCSQQFLINSIHEVHFLVCDIFIKTPHIQYVLYFLNKKFYISSL